MRVRFEGREIGLPHFGQAGGSERMDVARTAADLLELGAEPAIRTPLAESVRKVSREMLTLCGYRRLL
ncbi:hypothetical protein GCM10027569_23650 [Flindersiella endophytica]